MKFKVGDKVIARTDSPYSITRAGSRGTVVGTLENPNGQFIAPGDDICVKNNDDGACYSVESKYFDLVPECNQKIVITTNGKITTAKLYDGKKFVKKAKASCSPEDEFNFDTGALIAFSRLTGCDHRLSEVPEVPEVPEESLDWDEFKNDKIFVQVTEENFDDFINEAERHGCFFKNHDKFNPFKSFNAKLVMCLMRNADDGLSAPENTVFITYEDDLLKITPINIDNRTVFVW